MTSSGQNSWQLRDHDRLYDLEGDADSKQSRVRVIQRQPETFDVHETELLQVDSQPHYHLELDVVEDPLEVPQSGRSLVFAGFSGIDSERMKIAELAEMLERSDGSVDDLMLHLRVFDGDGRRIVDLDAQSTAPYRDLKRMLLTPNLERKAADSAFEDSLVHWISSLIGQHSPGSREPSLDCGTPLTWFFRIANTLGRLSAESGEILWQQAASTNDTEGDVVLLA